MKLFSIFVIFLLFVSCESKPFVPQDCQSRCEPHPYVFRKITLKNGEKIDVCLCRDAAGRLDFPSEFISGKEIIK